MKYIGLVLVVCVMSAASAEEVMPWDGSYRAFQSARKSGDADQAFAEAGKFLEYARLGFIPADDPRILEGARFWESEATRRRAELPVPTPEPQPTPETNKALSSETRERPKRTRKKKSAPTRDLVKRADEAIHNGRYDEAERLLERAKTIDPESSEIRKKWEALEAEMSR